MSDLQCPATVLLVPGRVLDPGVLGSSLSGRRLSGVFVVPSIVEDPEAHATARHLAASGSCPIETMPGVVDAASLEAAVDDLSDLFRGETIAVVAPSTSIEAVLGLAGGESRPIAVAIDGDGWVVLGR